MIGLIVTIQQKFQRHHKYFPKKDYISKGKIARMFRNLPCNIELMPEQEHRALHGKLRETAGGVPNHLYMAQQIADCFNRGCTKSNCKIAVGKIDPASEYEVNK